jgi:hypothetical protein
VFGRTKDGSIRRAAERIDLQAPPNVFVEFDRHLAATCLWDYGEDALSERVAEVSAKTSR